MHGTLDFSKLILKSTFDEYAQLKYLTSKLFMKVISKKKSFCLKRQVKFRQILGQKLILKLWI